MNKNISRVLRTNTRTFTNKIIKRIVCFRRKKKKKKIFSLAIIYSIFLSFCCYCTDKNMLSTNIMGRITCFLRESTKLSARSLRSLAIIYGFFFSFWFSGRYNSPRTKYWEELYVSDAKIKKFRVARKSFKVFFLSTHILLARNQLSVFLEFLFFFGWYN